MKKLLLPLLLLAACNTGRKTAVQKNSNMPAFDKQGHRGCRGLLPENTIAAMYRAIDLGVTTLEMDVVITKDSQVVLSHEPWMGHEIATRPDGQPVTAAEEKSLNIYRMTYEEVKRYDVGLKPHPRFPRQQKMAAVKPLLRDLIDSVRLYCERQQQPLPFFNIETKSLPPGDNLYHPPPERFVELLMAVIQEKKMERQVCIQSFDFRTLQYLHRQYPGVVTAMLIEDDDKRGIAAQLTALGYTPQIYSPHYSLVTAELLQFCKAKGIRVIPWTVNAKADIERLKGMGVDGIITDYPDLF